MAKSKNPVLKISALVVGFLVVSLFAMSYFQTTEEVSITSSVTAEKTKESILPASTDWTQKTDSIELHLKEARQLATEINETTATTVVKQKPEVSIPLPEKISSPVKKQEQPKKAVEKKIKVKEKENSIPAVKKERKEDVKESVVSVMKTEVPISPISNVNTSETLVSIAFTKLPLMEIKTIEVKEMEKVFSQEEIHSITAELVTDVKEVKKLKQIKKQKSVEVETETPIIDTIQVVQIDTIATPVIVPILEYQVFDEEERMREEVVENIEPQPTKEMVEEKIVTTEKTPVKIEIQGVDTALIASEIIPVGNSKTGMYHIMKENNRPMYTAAYDTVLPVTDMATAFVREVIAKDTLWSLIDIMSDTIRKTEFKSVEGPHYGLSIVKFSNGKHAHANQLGKVMYAIQFDGITPFHPFADTVCAFGQILGMVTVDTQKIPDLKYPFAEKKKKKSNITVTDPIYQIFVDGSIVLYDYR